MSKDEFPFIIGWHKFKARNTVNKKKAAMHKKYYECLESLKVQHDQAIKEAVEKACKERQDFIKKTLIESVSIMYRPHIEGVFAVIEHQLSQPKTGD